MVREKKTDIDKVISRSINNSYKFTAFESVRKGFGERYIEAFASFLNATPFQFTLLVSLPQFIGGVVQLFTSRFLNLFKTRKKMIYLLALLQGLIWIPMVFLAFSDSALRIWIYILCVIVYFILSLLHNPIWNSWIMDLVDFDRRGNFYALTTKVFNLATLISFVAGGFILSRARSSGSTIDITFAALFVISIISSLMSVRYIKGMHDPQYTYVRPKVSLKKFVKSINVDSQGNIILYISLMSFAVFIAAPFFTPYVLQTLNFSYLYYVILFSLPYFISLFFTNKIGGAIDRYGPKKVLKLTSFFLVITPVLWLVNDSFLWLIFVQLYAGLTYGAYEISSLAFFVNETNSSNRVSFFAYFNFIRGFFILAGALLSNFALMYGPFEIGFLNAFFWSAILRFLVLFINFPKKVREKDRYLPSSYGLLSKNMFLLTTPKEMMGKLVSAKEMIQTKVINRNEIITKLGSGEMVKIRRKADVLSNIEPGTRVKKKEPEKAKKKSSKKVFKPTHAVYFCTGCDAEFRRDISSRTRKKCPYCGHDKIFFMRHDTKRRSFSFLKD